MFSRILTSPERHFIGMRVRMSFAQNQTSPLWRQFMPRRTEPANVIGEELYSIEVYPSDFFEDFDPTREFEKWAAVEVVSPYGIPIGMESLTTPEGLYAVFDHKGGASEGPKTYQYIFSEWLPASEYRLDERPHFAVMGEKYKGESPESEEEIWIPVAPK